MFKTKPIIQSIISEDPFTRYIKRTLELLAEEKKAEEAFELAVLNAERIVLGLPRVNHNLEKE